MPRTKSTARKSTTKQPRKQLPSRPAEPNVFTIAHQNQFELLREKTPFGGDASEPDCPETDPPTPVTDVTRYSNASTSSGLSDELVDAVKRSRRPSEGSVRDDDGNEEARASQQHHHEDEHDEPLQEEEEEHGNTTSMSIRQSEANTSNSNAITGNESAKRRKMSSKPAERLLHSAKEPSGLTYSQAIPVHGTQLPQAHIPNHHQNDQDANAAVMSDDPDLSQERLKRGLPSSEDDEKEDNESDTNEEDDAGRKVPAKNDANNDAARPRKKAKRSNSVPTEQSIRKLPARYRGGRAEVVPENWGKAGAVNKTEKTAGKQSKEKDQVEASETNDTFEEAAEVPAPAADPQAEKKHEEKEEKEENQETSPFLNFETLPGSPIQPFDTRALMVEYEVIADDYDMKMQGE